MSRVWEAMLLRSSALKAVKTSLSSAAQRRNCELLKLFGKFLASLKIFRSPGADNAPCSNTEIPGISGGFLKRARILSKAPAATQTFEQSECDARKKQQSS